MSTFKKVFSLVVKKDIDKTLDALLDDALAKYINEQSFEKFVNTLNNRDPKYTKLEALEALFKSVQQISTWPKAIKALMVLHRMIHTIGGEFFQMFAPSKVANIATFKTDKSTLKNLNHSVIVPIYYNYLLKLAYSYDELRICFFPVSDPAKHISEDKTSLMIYLSKIQNHLLYLFKLLTLLDASLEQFPDVNMIKQMAYFCLTDCSSYYVYLNEIIKVLTKQFFSLPEENILSLYELYCDHIKLTNQLEKIFGLRNYIKEFSLQVPELFKIDTENNREIELYVLSLRKEAGQRSSYKSSSPDNSPKRTKNNLMNNRDTAFTQRAIIDMEQIIPNITMPNTVRQELFKPPKLVKQGGSPNSCSQLHSTDASNHEVRLEIKSRNKDLYMQTEPMLSAKLNRLCTMPNQKGNQMYTQVNHDTPNQSINESAFQDNSYVMG